MTSKKALILCAASCLALLSGNAFAAEPAASASVEEVVVTAQRRSETAQSVPISLTAVSGEQMAAAGVDRVTDLKRLAPSFFAGSPPQAAGMRLNIRGIGSPGSVDPSVATFVDGVYIARTGALLGELLDIERVEVLSGPQGTLFGRNAAVGALNITTAAPQFTTAASASAEVGTAERVRGKLMLTGPLTDDVAGRFAAAFSSFDGYGKNLLDGRTVGRQDVFTTRAGLRFRGEVVDWTVRADYQFLSGDGVAVVTVDEDTVTPRAAANFAATTRGRAPRLTGTYDQVISQVAGGKITDRNRGLASDLNIDLGDHTLRLISGVRDWNNRQDETDVLYTAASLLGRDVRFFSETQSQELQLVSPDEGRLTYVGGLYYFHEKNGSQGRSNLGADWCDVLVGAAPRPTCNAALASGVFPAQGAGRWDLGQSTTSYAAYGQATLAATEALKLTLGARYSRDEKTGFVLFTRANPFLGGVVVPDADRMEADWERFTYRVNVSYDLSDDVMIFATHSTGYKSGGFDQSTGLAANADRVFQPEFSTNYELGVKSQSMDRRITANATLFQMDVDDLQVRSYDASTNSFNTRNAGSVRQSGVEFDLRARPASGLTLGLAATYLDSEYTEFRNAPPRPGMSGVQDLTGQRSSFSPKWQGAASVGYQGQINDRFGFDFDSTFSFTSRAYVGGEADNNPQGDQPAYNLLSARLAVYPVSKDWQIAVLGENLTDEGYCVAKFTQPSSAGFGLNDGAGGAVQRCILGAPRTVRLQASFRY